MTDSASVVQKLWNHSNVLRDDGLSYQDYIEQLTFLLFLTMADEGTKPPWTTSWPATAPPTGPSASRRSASALSPTRSRSPGDKGPLDIVWLRDESAVLGPAHSVNQIVQTYRSWHHSEQILDYCLTAGALRWGISIAHACGQSKGYEHRKQLRGAHHGLEGSLTVRRRCASINLTRVQ
jgi:hypothetical protein